MSHSVLVVDDEPLLVSAWCEALSDEGFATEGFTDGYRALSAFDRERHDVIVTDMLMPDVEGFEIIRRVRNIVPGVKVLAVSGGGRHWKAATLLRWAGNVGADALLEKPFAIDVLLGAVRELVERPSVPGRLS